MVICYTLHTQISSELNYIGMHLNTSKTKKKAMHSMMLTGLEIELYSSLFSFFYFSGDLMQNYLIEHLTSKDNKQAYEFSKKIISNSEDWYEYFDVFVSLLNHENSLVRNRTMSILAAIVEFDDENKFDDILDDFLSHINDKKAITSRQCIKYLAIVGTNRPRYNPQILNSLEMADLSKYSENMRPLIEKDIKKTQKILSSI